MDKDVDSTMTLGRDSRTAYLKILIQTVDQIRIIRILTFDDELFKTNENKSVRAVREALDHLIL